MENQTTAATKVKCIFSTCFNLVGPIRQQKTNMCYTCERNLDDWAKRGMSRRVAWRARVTKFNERLATFRDAEQETSKVASFVAAQLKRKLKKAS